MRKTRLVTKGYSQMATVDFNETFAPMAKFIIIRNTLAIGTAMDWEIHQMDVKTTFVNEIFKVKIYMDQLEGFVQEENEHLVCKLKNTLYGIKQSPKAGDLWHSSKIIP